MEDKKGLKLVTKMANRKAAQRRRDGEVPKHMSLDGQLALMHDKIGRYFKDRNLDEILGLASDGLFALEAAYTELDSDEISDEEFDNYIEPDEPVEEDISDLLPVEFKDWEEDKYVATALMIYLEDAGQWENLDKHFKDLIEGAATGGSDEN